MSILPFLLHFGPGYSLVLIYLRVIQTWRVDSTFQEISVQSNKAVLASSQVLEEGLTVSLRSSCHPTTNRGAVTKSEPSQDQIKTGSGQKCQITWVGLDHYGEVHKHIFVKNFSLLVSDLRNAFQQHIMNFLNQVTWTKYLGSMIASWSEKQIFQIHWKILLWMWGDF